MSTSRFLAALSAGGSGSGTVSADFAASYAVLAMVDRDFSASYDIESASSVLRDFAGAFAVSAFVQRDFAGAYDVAASDNDIRLQPGLYLQRGGYAASRSSLRWRAFLPDHGDVAASGVGLSTNSSGQAVIDIDDSPFTVGDWVELQVIEYNAATAPADRTVLVFSGFVQAIAQA